MHKLAVFSLLLSSCGLPHSYASSSSSIILQNIVWRPDLLEYTELALNLTKRFIAPHTNTLVIMEKCEFFVHELQLVHTTLLHNFLPNLGYSINVQLFFGQPDERLWDYNLFVVDSWWGLRLSLVFTSQIW